MKISFRIEGIVENVPIAISRNYLSPPPAIAATATRTNAHQYFWRNVFSMGSPSGVVSLPSAPITGGLRLFNKGAGPGVGSTILTLTLDSVPGGCCVSASDLIFEVGSKIGSGSEAVTEALYIDPSPFGDARREMVCTSDVLKVATEVKEELPFGSRTRRSLEEVEVVISGFAVAGDRDGGVHEEMDDVSVCGS